MHACMQVGKPQRLRLHFDDMLHAFISVFIIITCDNYTDHMYPMMSVSVPLGKRKILHLYPMMSVCVCVSFVGKHQLLPLHMYPMMSVSVLCWEAQAPAFVPNDECECPLLGSTSSCICTR